MIGATNENDSVFVVPFAVRAGRAPAPSEELLRVLARSSWWPTLAVAATPEMPARPFIRLVSPLRSEGRR